MVEERQIGKIQIIRGQKGGHYPFCHSLFLEEDGILIDPASDYEALKQLSAAEAVSNIWLSHWHEDHFTFLNLFPQAPIRISEKDFPPLCSLEVFLDFYGIDKEEHRQYWAETLVDTFHYQPRKSAAFFRDGEEISLVSDTVRVINTPGHTPGHISLHFLNHNVLFLGDYDLTPFGPWYGDRDSSIEETITSLQKLRQIPAALFVTSHGLGFVSAAAGEALWEHYIAVIFQRQECILSALQELQTLDELASLWLIYKKPREPKGFFEFGERALLKKHLEHLMREGMVESVGGGQYRKR